MALIKEHTHTIEKEKEKTMKQKGIRTSNMTQLFSLVLQRKSRSKVSQLNQSPIRTQDDVFTILSPVQLRKKHITCVIYHSL